MSKQMEALLMIAEDPALVDCFLSFIDVVREEVDWDFNYRSLSGGQQTMISWAYTLWTDEPPSKNKFRELFDGFGSLETDSQFRILRAVIHRFGIDQSRASGEVLVRLLSGEGGLKAVK